MSRIDYTEANKLARKYKSALTRAKNRGDHRKVMAVCEQFVEAFGDRDWPLPDNWHLWQIAYGDAALALRREES